MKFRVSQYTPYLLISLAITMIIRYFFDPLQLPSETYTLWDIKNNTVVNMDMDAFQTMVMGNVMNKIIHLLCPILSEISDWLKYFYGIMDDRGAIIIASEIMMVGYVIFTYFLEKFHAYWHNEESCFAVCIDILCVENIASYILSLVFYFIRQAFIHCNISEDILLFIAAVIGISCMWIVICYFCYLFANLIITLGLPVMLGYLLEAVLTKNMVLVIKGLLILFTTQIVWRLCSDKIFNKLIEVFSFHRLNLD